MKNPSSLYQETDHSGSPNRKQNLGIEECTPSGDNTQKICDAQNESFEATECDNSTSRGDKMSIPDFVSNSSCDKVPDHDIMNFVENPEEIEIRDLHNMEVKLPMNQKPKLVRLFLTMQAAVQTAKSDMEDLIARLNQESAMNEYLNTKVKDLEVELDVTKQKNKEMLQHAVFFEGEKVREMQWEMEELRRKCFQMEAKLKSEQTDANALLGLDEKSFGVKSLAQELDAKEQELSRVKKELEEEEKKSKSDIKVLVKEVKSLRSSQSELKQLAEKYSEEKISLQRALDNEREIWKNVSSSQRKLLCKCKHLQDQLHECSVNKFLQDGNCTIDSSLLGDALDLLATSDDTISALVAQAQLLVSDKDDAATDSENTDGISTGEPTGNRTAITINGENPANLDAGISKTLVDLFMDNTQMRKHLNCIMRSALSSGQNARDLSK